MESSPLTIRTLAITAIVLFGLTAAAQTVPPHNTVTATIKDANGHPYSKAFYQIQLIDSAGRAIPGTTRATYQGQPVAPTQFTGNLDTSGTFTISVVPNNAVGLLPTTTQWQINISAPNNMYLYNDARNWSLQYTTAITADTNLSSQLSAIAQPVSYIDVNGPSAFRAPVFGLDPTDPKMLATKGYVDAAVGGASSVLPGTQYHLGQYTNAQSPQIAPNNITTDATGNNLTVPTTLTTQKLAVTGCSTGQVPLGDGSGTCVTTGGSVSGLVNGFIPLASGATTINAPSAIDDGVTTPNTITSSEPVVVGALGAGSVSSATIGGSRYASRWGDGSTNGIATAQGANLKVVSGPAYPMTETPTAATFTATPTWWADERVSQNRHYFRNPGTDTTGEPVWANRNGTYGEWGFDVECSYDTTFKTQGYNVRPGCMQLTFTRKGPGSNLGNPAAGPQGWNSSSAIYQTTKSYGKGILGISRHNPNPERHRRQCRVVLLPVLSRWMDRTLR
jgi:hypothetical protein